MPMQISAGNQYLPRVGEKVLEEGNRRANLLDQMAAYTDQQVLKETGDDKRLAEQLAMKQQLQQQALAAKAAIAAARGNGEMSEQPLEVDENGNPVGLVLTPQAYAKMFVDSFKGLAPGQKPSMPFVATEAVRDKKGKIVQYKTKINPNYLGQGLRGVVADPSQADLIAEQAGIGKIIGDQ